MAGEEPDLNLLVPLRALLEEANVTRAGARIQMGQSTMSAALSRLRAQFDDELLVRVGRDYELTPLARQLLPHVQRTIPRIERALGLEQEFDPALNRRSYRLQLSDYAAIQLQPLLARVQRLAPGVHVDLLPLPAEIAPADRDMHAIDFLVTVPDFGVEGDSIELFRDEYVCVIDQDNPAIADGVLSVDDLVRLPHARCDFGRGQITPIDRRVRELGLRYDIRITTTTLVTLPTVVAGTELVAMAPRRLMERATIGTRAIVVPTPFPPVELLERLWWHPAHDLDPAHVWFRRVAEDAVAEGMFAA